MLFSAMSGKSATGMFGWYSNAADADLGEQLQKGNACFAHVLHLHKVVFRCVMSS